MTKQIRNRKPLSQPRNKYNTLSRDGIIDALRYLGWHTLNQDGTIPDDVFNVAKNLSGRVVESITLPSILAKAMDDERARLKSLSSYGPEETCKS